MITWAGIGGEVRANIGQLGDFQYTRVGQKRILLGVQAQAQIQCTLLTTTQQSQYAVRRQLA